METVKQKVSLIKPVLIDFLKGTDVTFFSSSIWTACRFLSLKDAKNGNEKLDDERKLFFAQCHYDNIMGIDKPYGCVRNCKVLSAPKTSLNGALPLFYIVNIFNSGLIPCEKIELDFRELVFPMTECFLNGHDLKEKIIGQRKELFCLKCQKAVGYYMKGEKLCA